MYHIFEEVLLTPACKHIHADQYKSQLIIGFEYRCLISIVAKFSYFSYPYLSLFFGSLVSGFDLYSLFGFFNLCYFHGNQQILLKDTKEGVFGIRVASQLELPSNDDFILSDAQDNPTKGRQRH